MPKQFLDRPDVRPALQPRGRAISSIAMQDALPEGSPDWEQVRPVLDDAMDELKAEDRNAVLLRFFEERDLRAVGLALGISEDAAQKRVARALEKLRVLLIRRGVTLSAGALAAAISGGAVQSAPPGLAVSVGTASLAAGAGVGANGLTSGLITMTTSKITTGLLAISVATALIVHNLGRISDPKPGRICGAGSRAGCGLGQRGSVGSPGRSRGRWSISQAFPPVATSVRKRPQMPAAESWRHTRENACSHCS